MKIGDAKWDSQLTTIVPISKAAKAELYKLKKEYPDVIFTYFVGEAVLEKIQTERMKRQTSSQSLLTEVKEG